MQKAKVKYFKDRSLFYVTFPIRDQAQQGDRNFKLASIYFVAILDFEYDEAEERRKLRRDVALKDQDGEIFFDKLHFKFLQMPLFNKKESELETKFDKWCYFLKNLENFDHIPAILNEPIFQKAFGTAELAGFSAEQRDRYEQSLIQYRDLKSALETALEEREIEIARNFIALNLDNATIAKGTGLSVEQIEQLRNEIKKNG
jgi:predicted transposase/invertase (TIGR01784 family)